MKNILTTAAAAILTAATISLNAQNPAVSTWCTPDPAPYAHGDTLWLFTGHDADTATYFRMPDWQLYSTTDMVNFTYHGRPITTATFAWAKQGDNAWASQAIERNGKWYWYVAAEDTTKHLHGIGVAVADRPEGPYRDAIGKPLVPGDWGFIDPSVFVDDDGSAWLFWGNNGLWYAELNEDMTSLKGDIRAVDISDSTAFGPLVMKHDYALGRKTLKGNFEEAPWIYRRGNLYYLEYAAGGVPEHWAYSTAHSIHGPWTYRGRVMAEPPGSFTIHGGAVTFKGRSFMFYHNGLLPWGGGFRRSTAVEEFRYGGDGSIPFIPFTSGEARKPIHNLNPYRRTEAETMASCRGIKTDTLAGKSHYVTCEPGGGWIRVRCVDFAEGAAGVSASVRNTAKGAGLEFRLDSVGGALLCDFSLPKTAGKWKKVRGSAKATATGVHDLYIVFRGGRADLDYWQIEGDRTAAAGAKGSKAKATTYQNPVIYADCPDPDVCRVGDTFYMVSTTMHMSPGCTIMKSSDLVNWTVCGYAHDQLEETDNFALRNGQSDYAAGSWAANIRHDKYEGLFYVIVTCNTTGKSYIFTSKDAERGGWKRYEVDKCYDPGLLFEDTGKECKKWVVHPEDDLGRFAGFRRELITDGGDTVYLGAREKIIDYANLENPAQGLRAEGYHGYKIGDYYYIFMIQGVGAQRQETVWRSKTLEPGSFEGRRVFAGNIKNPDGTDYLPFTGVAQGGVVDTPDGRWYAMLFQDYGAVGRIPVLIPMTWDADGWPVIGNGGESVDRTNAMPGGGALAADNQRTGFGVTASDEFDNQPRRYKISQKESDNEEYKYNGSNLKLNWQWNHNPDNRLWSLTERKGWLRLKSGWTTPNIRHARNTLTQRTFGPTSAAATKLDVSGMRDGDFAGIASYQNQYGLAGVTQENGKRYIVMRRAQQKDDAEGKEIARKELTQNEVWLKVACDFTDKRDTATFFYSLDGKDWTKTGDELKMAFDWPDFVGQRFGLFYFSTSQTGGHADFDWFRVSDKLDDDFSQKAK